MRRVCFLVLLILSVSEAYPDLYVSQDLRQVVQHHTRDGHVVLFTYVANLEHMWRDMTMELCAELNDRKDPYLVLTHDDKSCDELISVSVGRLETPPVCVLDSVLHKTHGYPNDVLTLWVRRYHAASLLSEAGVSVTLMDADSIITHDFVPILRNLEREYALIALGEGPINGGLWHLRASNSSSAALWVIKQVERRTTLLEKYKVHDHDHDPGIQMDQIEVGDALRVASDPNGSAFDFWSDFRSSSLKNHEVWRRFPQTEPTRGFEWRLAPHMMRSPWTAADTCEYANPDTCLRFEAFVKQYDLRESPTLFADLCVPFDSEQYDETAPCEKILRAPTWLFSHGDPLVNGFPSTIAVYHLLGVNSWWGEQGSGSHVSRYAQWLARPGMKTYRERHDGVYLKAPDLLIKAACAHKDISRTRLLVKHVMNSALSKNAMAIMPQFPCDCAWIRKGNTSYLGFEDHRVVDDGGRCYPAPAGWDSCFPGIHFTYPFLVPSNATVETLSRLPNDNDDNDKHEHVRHACASFFEVE